MFEESVSHSLQEYEEFVLSRQVPLSDGHQIGAVHR